MGEAVKSSRSFSFLEHSSAFPAWHDSKEYGKRLAAPNLFHRLRLHFATWSLTASPPAKIWSLAQNELEAQVEASHALFLFSPRNVCLFPVAVVPTVLELAGKHPIYLLFWEEEEVSSWAYF